MHGKIELNRKIKPGLQKEERYLVHTTVSATIVCVKQKLL